MKKTYNGLLMQEVAFGTGVIKRFYRNKKLYYIDLLKSALKSIKHLKLERKLYNDLFIDSILKKAYDCGYRMFDSGRLYGHSEKKIGELIKQKPRDEIFLITKIADVDLERYKNINTVGRNLDISLSNLKTKYVDLLLLHFPHGNWKEMYRDMENEYKNGRARALGVCNFDIEELVLLMSICEVPPMVCQVEMNPLNTKKKLLSFCREKEIIIMAHTPTAHMDKRILLSPIMNKLTNKYHKSAGQIIYRWHIQNGVIPIISSVSEKHIKENINIFDFSLSETEMKCIDELNEDYSFDENNNKENDCPNFIYNI